MTKKRLTAFLTRWWWIYLLVPVLAYTIWSPLFRAAVKPPEEQTLKLIFVGTGLDEDTLERDLLAASLGQEVNAVYIDTVNYASAETRFTAIWAGSLEADLMIFSEDMLPEDLASQYFPSLVGEWESVDVYAEDGIAYGLRLGDGFARYCTGEEEYVLFFTDIGLEKGLALAAADWLRRET